jgi:hypothetical protein
VFYGPALASSHLIVAVDPVYDLQQPHSMPYMCQSGRVRVRADRYGPVPLLPGLREDLAGHGRGQDPRHDRRIARRQTRQDARVRVELLSYEELSFFLLPFTCGVATSSIRNVLIPSTVLAAGSSPCRRVGEDRSCEHDVPRTGGTRARKVEKLSTGGLHPLTNTGG